MKSLFSMIVIGLAIAGCTTGGAIGKIQPGMSAAQVDEKNFSNHLWHYRTFNKETKHALQLTLTILSTFWIYR